MLPEAALTKLMWVLGNEKDRTKAAAMMQDDLKGEWMTRSAHGL
jgi:glutamyl-tRNA(Gln) amidotransferase subunit D